MKYERKTGLRSLLRVKIGLACLTPIAAYAADQAIHRVESITLWTWFFILMFSTIGWAVKDLDRVAEWWNTEGRKVAEIVKARLGIIQSLTASNGAGICTYLSANTLPGWLDMKEGFPEFAIFVAVTVAGFYGTAWFQRASKKMFGRDNEN